MFSPSCCTAKPAGAGCCRSPPFCACARCWCGRSLRFSAFSNRWWNCPSHASTDEEGPGPSGDIEALISAGEEEGIIEKDDRKLIESVVAFGDKTVREVMTPRPKIVAIEANRSLEDLRELVIHEQYSRIPVYERSIDNIIGFVHVRDMFELDEADRAGPPA